MAAKDLLKAESTLNCRFQTTIPAIVRKALDLDQGDILNYKILDSGDVILSKKAHALEHDDPLLKHFLPFLEKDIQQHPEHLIPLTEGRMAKLSELLQDVQYDINTPLPEDSD